MTGIYFYVMNTKTARIVKIEVTPITDSGRCPSEVFDEISEEYGRKLDMKEIKRELFALTDYKSLYEQ